MRLPPPVQDYASRLARWLARKQVPAAVEPVLRNLDLARQAIDALRTAEVEGQATTDDILKRMVACIDAGLTHPHDAAVALDDDRRARLAAVAKAAKPPPPSPPPRGGGGQR